MKSREEVLTQTVKHLFNTIGAEDILREESGVWYLQGNPIDENTKKLLIAEAQQFLNTRLWKVLQMDIKYQATKAMFEDSKDIIDMTAGKLQLYVLDIIETRLKSMSKKTGIFNKYP